MEKSFTDRLDALRRLVDRRLSALFGGEGLEEAMRYSLMAGGKRVRPVLTLAFCQAAGGAPERALDFACGVELLHTYSLIHDDLPCMDDDDLRRGKPTCHKVYGACVATLAGDALQAAAFQTVLCGGAVGQTAAAQAAAVLARAAGVEGMCAGQYWDTLGDGKPHTLEELTAIHAQKTGALLKAACVMGVLAADGSTSCVDAAAEYASHLGLAFQIRDDILDATSTTETLGKPVGSDAANGKTTYVTLLGARESERLVLEHTDLARAALEKGDWRGDVGFLRQLAQALASRTA